MSLYVQCCIVGITNGLVIQCLFAVPSAVMLAFFHMQTNYLLQVCIQFICFVMDPVYLFIMYLVYLFCCVFSLFALLPIQFICFVRKKQDKY